MKAELWWQGDCMLGESPLWSPLEQAFYWVDISGRTLWRHDGGSGAPQQWRLPQALGCIALGAQPGRLLAALQDGVYALSLGEGEPQLALLADAPHGSDMRFNDGRCDRQGRFWVGSLHEPTGPKAAREPRGWLARLSLPEESTAPWQPPFQTGLLLANGLGFSPDGRRLYFSDSHASRACVWACDYDPERGQPGEPVPFIPALPTGRPDGAAVDAEGGYWICANDGAAVYRYTPQGRLDRRVDVPVRKPTMCAFGGPDMDLLLITSMRPPDARPGPLDGALFALRPGVAGLAETPARH